MKVKFKYPFFGPGGDVKTRDGRHLSGVLYDPGVHDNVPDGIQLPPSAIILDDKKAEPLPLPAHNPLHDHDPDRAAGDNFDKATAKADEERTKRKPGRPKKYE